MKKRKRGTVVSPQDELKAFMLGLEKVSAEDSKGYSSLLSQHQELLLHLVRTRAMIGSGVCVLVTQLPKSLYLSLKLSDFVRMDKYAQKLDFPTTINHHLTIQG